MIDLTGRDDIPVAEDVLTEVAGICNELDMGFLVVGATARDLVIHALQQKHPVRATNDVDIAVAVHISDQFSALTDRLTPKGKSQHTFDVLGVDVDVVPFGGIETDRHVLFADDHLLDVTGPQEAHQTSVLVRMPLGTELQVASAPAQTALKCLAWRDRHLNNPKDGLDLGVILSALSEDPFDDDVWNDDEALDETHSDIVTAASFHYARIAARPFAEADGRAVLDVLHNPEQKRALIRDMRTPLADELINAYVLGFARGLSEDPTSIL